MKSVLYPGSFDPITNGHMNVIEKAVKFFDRVVIAIIQNPEKSKGLFSLQERYEMIKEIYENCPNIVVICVDEPITAVDVAEKNNCIGIIKGLRNVTDYEQEVQMARINKKISKTSIETVMLVADSEMQDVSSSLVRQLWQYNKDVSHYVDIIVENKFKEKLNS